MLHNNNVFTNESLNSEGGGSGLVVGDNLILRPPNPEVGHVRFADDAVFEQDVNFLSTVDFTNDVTFHRNATTKLTSTAQNSVVINNLNVGHNVTIGDPAHQGAVTDFVINSDTFNKYNAIIQGDFTTRRATNLGLPGQGDVTVLGPLKVASASEFSNPATFLSDVTFGSSGTTGNVTSLNPVTVNNVFTVAGDTVLGRQPSDGVDIKGNVLVVGPANLTCGNKLIVADDVVFGNNAHASATTNFTVHSNMFCTYNVTCSKQFTANGNVTLGNHPADVVSVQGRATFTGTTALQGNVSFGPTSVLTSNSTNTEWNGPVTFNDTVFLNGPATLGATTFSGTATLNNTATFNDTATFNNPAVFNDTATFNNPVTHNADVAVGGTLNMQGNQITNGICQVQNGVLKIQEDIVTKDTVFDTRLEIVVARFGLGLSLSPTTNRAFILSDPGVYKVDANITLVRKSAEHPYGFFLRLSTVEGQILGTGTGSGPVQDGYNLTDFCGTSVTTIFEQTTPDVKYSVSFQHFAQQSSVAPPGVLPFVPAETRISDVSRVFITRLG